MVAVAKTLAGRTFASAHRWRGLVTSRPQEGAAPLRHSSTTPIAFILCPWTGPVVIQSTLPMRGMRKCLLLAGLSFGCGDQFTVVNAEPDVMITSHGNGDLRGGPANALHVRGVRCR